MGYRVDFLLSLHTYIVDNYAYHVHGSTLTRVDHGSKFTHVFIAMLSVDSCWTMTMTIYL
jgi:hypothetical protein